MNMTTSEVLTAILENLVWAPIGAIGALAIFHLSRFIRRANVANDLLQGVSIKNAIAKQRYFRRYTRPSFLAVNFCDAKKETISYRTLWRSIIKGTHKVLFIIAEAGMGKTMLTRNLVYKLKVRNLHKNSEGIYDSEEVYYERFSEITDIETVASQIGSGEFKYIILDGFDECPLLSEKDASELLEELIARISKKSSKYKKLIITSRIEYVRHGEQAIKNKAIFKENTRGEYQREGVEVVRLNYLNKKQIKAIYRFHVSLIKPSRHDSNLKRTKNYIKFRKYLKKIKINECIFRNPFFVTYANDLLSSFATNELIAISPEDAFIRIVKSRFVQEHIKGGYDMQLDSFIQIVESEIRKIVEAMAVQKKLYLEDPDLLNKKYLRLFFSRSNDRVEFLHRLFLEYYIAKNIPSIHFYFKKNLLLNHLNHIDKDSVIRFYLLILNRDWGESMGKSLGTALSKELLLPNACLTIKKETILTVRELINIFPQVDKISFGEYELSGLDIDCFIVDSYLDLDGQGIGDISDVVKFGEFSEIDIRNTKIQNISPLRSTNHLKRVYLSGHCFSSANGARFIDVINDPAMLDVEFIIDFNWDFPVDDLLVNVSGKKIYINPILDAANSPVFYHHLFEMIDSGITNFLIYNMPNEQLITEYQAILGDRTWAVKNTPLKMEKFKLPIFNPDDTQIASIYFHASPCFVCFMAILEHLDISKFFSKLLCVLSSYGIEENVEIFDAFRQVLSESQIELHKVFSDDFSPENGMRWGIKSAIIRTYDEIERNTIIGEKYHIAKDYHKALSFKTDAINELNKFKDTDTDMGRNYKYDLCWLLFSRSSTLYAMGENVAANEDLELARSLDVISGSCGMFDPNRDLYEPYGTEYEYRTQVLDRLKNKYGVY